MMIQDERWPRKCVIIFTELEWDYLDLPALQDVPSVNAFCNALEDELSQSAQPVIPASPPPPATCTPGLLE